MSQPKKSLEWSLDPSANQALLTFVGDLRETLLSEAAKTSRGGQITEDDLTLAYKRLSFPTSESIQFADAQSVISHALKENRVVEWVSYAMAVILFGFGLVLLCEGAFSSDVAARVGCLLSGSIVELLILVPFRFAINSRRHNIALRMLGLVINRVDDPKKLAPLLKDTFLCVVLGKAKFETAPER